MNYDNAKAIYLKTRRDQDGEEPAIPAFRLSTKDEGGTWNFRSQFGGRPPVLLGRVLSDGRCFLSYDGETADDPEEVRERLIAAFQRSVKSI